MSAFLWFAELSTLYIYNICIAHIFFTVCGLSFHSLNMASFDEQKFFTLSVIYQVFVCLWLVLCVFYFRKILSTSRSWRQSFVKKFYLFHLGLQFNRNWFCAWCESVFIYPLWISSWSELFIEKIIMSPQHVAGFQVTICVWVCFWTLCSVPLACSSVFGSVPHCLNYWLHNDIW